MHFARQNLSSRSFLGKGELEWTEVDGHQPIVTAMTGRFAANRFLPDVCELADQHLNTCTAVDSSTSLRHSVRVSCAQTSYSRQWRTSGCALGLSPSYRSYPHYTCRSLGTRTGMFVLFPKPHLHARRACANW